MGQRRPRVLVVDDHLDTLQLFESALSLEGFSVTVAANGNQAAELARDGFDVVVTDLAMPGMDGIELIRTLRARDPHHPIPILVVSGQIVPGRNGLEETGCCGLMTKPCDLDTLANRIRGLVDACRHDCAPCAYRYPTARPATAAAEPPAEDFGRPLVVRYLRAPSSKAACVQAFRPFESATRTRT